MSEADAPGFGLTALGERVDGAGGAFRARWGEHTDSRRSRPIDRTGSESLMDELPIRLLIADDQHLIRGGLRAIIDAEPDLRVVAEAGEGSGATWHHPTSRPQHRQHDRLRPAPAGPPRSSRLCTTAEPTIPVAPVTNTAGGFLIGAPVPVAAGQRECSARRRSGPRTAARRQPPRPVRRRPPRRQPPR